MHFNKRDMIRRLRYAPLLLAFVWVKAWPGGPTSAALSERANTPIDYPIVKTIASIYYYNHYYRYCHWWTLLLRE
ncbi:hypothetical protein BIW11_12251 [Tropilaelaps mercedesae]|uniref:Uncharacterized protein n=1 Tax=Tropilaelaps mercedesae TaxID=418985 RepID=A0A1V9X7S3_9ACAR|nr:hypothetical protein BIW11_12251 [Tropilaelaps mercedesae]